MDPLHPQQERRDNLTAFHMTVEQERVKYYTDQSTFLMGEPEAYDGCVPIELGLPEGNRIMVYAPPWDTAQYSLNDLIDDVVITQMRAFPEARMDDKGQLYESTKTRTGMAAKHLIQQAIPLEDILAQLRNGGYKIPDDYFKQHPNRVRILHLRPA